MSIGFALRYAARALRRGGQRTLLAVLCVAVGVMAIVALQLVGAMVSLSLTGNTRALNGGDLAVSGVNLRGDQLGAFAQLQAQGALTAYTATASNQASAQSPHPVSRFDVLLVDPTTFPLAGAPTFETPAQGQLRTTLGPTNMVLTQSLAQQMSAHVGDTFPVILADGHVATLTVGAIIANGGLFQQPLLLMSFATLAAFNQPASQPPLYTAIYADVPGHSAARANSAANQIEARYPDASILTAQDLLRNNQQEVNGIQSFLRLVGLSALLLGGMGIINTMQVLLRRRTTEIALLKASGYGRRNLYALFGVEAALLGVLGGLLGAAMGVGASLALKDVVGSTFSLVLPLTLDPLIVASGVVVGAATALIFGLLPIVQASRLRPIAILREQTDETSNAGRVRTVGLWLVVVALFYLLALAILGDPMLALALVGGASAALGLLALAFALVDAATSRLPVPGYVAGGTTVKLALRNLGRQRGGTVTTQVALFVSVFAVGLILVVGQGLRAQYAQGGNNVNAIIWTHNLGAVRQRLQQSAAVTRVDVYRETGFAPAAINGQEVTTEQAAFQYAADGLAPLNLMLGFDLAHNLTPAAPDFTLVAGRMLNAGDAGSNRVVGDAALRQAPLGLHVGDVISVRYFDKLSARSGGAASGPTFNFTIVGFYQNNTGVPSLQSTLLADTSAVDAVGGQNAYYEFGIHINPQSADAVLTALQAALPGQVFVHSYVDAFLGIESYLSNLILMLEVIVLPALLAAVANIGNVVALAVLDRRRELAILKAVGHSSGGVLADIVVEQGVAALCASLLAMAGAGALALVASQKLNIVSDQSARATEGSGLSLPISIPLASGVVGAAVVLALLATVVVAWGASHRRPLEALRYE